MKKLQIDFNTLSLEQLAALYCAFPTRFNAERLDIDEEMHKLARTTEITETIQSIQSAMAKAAA